MLYRCSFVGLLHKTELKTKISADNLCLTHPRTDVYVCVCVYIYMYVSKYVCMYVCMYMYVYMYVCMYVCVCVCICIFLLSMLHYFGVILDAINLHVSFICRRRSDQHHGVSHCHPFTILNSTST